jgi:hypothetical protein
MTKLLAALQTSSPILSLLIAVMFVSWQIIPYIFPECSRLSAEMRYYVALVTDGHFKVKHQVIDSRARSCSTCNDRLFLRMALEVLMIRDCVLTALGQLWNRSDLTECLRSISRDSRL